MAVTPGDRYRISELLARGMTVREVAARLGYTFNQVRSAIDRYKLRKTPAARPGCSVFTHKQLARMKALTIQRIQEGVPIPGIVDEIERRTGKRVHKTAVRKWVPDELSARVEENGRLAKVIRNKQAARNNQALRDRIKELEAENARLRVLLKKAKS